MCREMESACKDSGRECVCLERERERERWKVCAENGKECFQIEREGVCVAIDRGCVER